MAEMRKCSPLKMPRRLFLIATEHWYLKLSKCSFYSKLCSPDFTASYDQVDSMPMWLENWKVTCRHFNIAMTDHDFHRHAGRPIEEMLRNLCAEQKLEVRSAGRWPPVLKLAILSAYPRMPDRIELSPCDDPFRTTKPSLLSAQHRPTRVH